MRAYAVGGAVRDALLGRPVKDRDYVVVGSTPDEMVAAGFRQVGADFPVFLHPVTREEYALARTETKTGPGHHGFETRHGPEVGLVEDLRRRDLTCNAMAFDEDGRLVDPFGGARDLEAGVLRHTSEAFGEDPVRILRVARFAARLGFAVAPETRDTCAAMVRRGDLDQVTTERVASELRKALSEARPSVFFRELLACGALRVVLPEVAALVGRPQSPVHHREGDAFEHTMAVVDAAASAGGDGLVTFGALVHDLGKAVTDDAALPGHHGHEALGAPIVDALCDRLRLPNDVRRSARLCATLHGHAHRGASMRPGSYVRCYEAMSRQTFAQDLGVLVAVAKADEAGRDAEGRTLPEVHDEFAQVMGAVAAVRLGLAFTAERIAAMPVEERGERLRAAQAVAAGVAKAEIATRAEASPSP